MDEKKCESSGKKDPSNKPRLRNRNHRKGDSSGKAKSKASPGQDNSDDDDNTICFICANPITYYAFGPCDHKCCFKCCLRTRALYKSKLCPVCKSDQPFVIFFRRP
ncbi:hypothetical protein DSO57_1017167 [Entomophthora muscae]|uniref:Uncharacterized protein n=1 Tax=Entomophthora muscae TaxID=34485 RepID=A0ACC2RVS0_9FUNG|nr:hypothetical protein DSO57_1017167 [Entomophthora muscae]